MPANRGFAGLVALLVVLIGLGAGCSPSSSSSAPSSGEIAASTAVGRAEGSDLAPEFALQDLDGTVVRLSDSAGRVRLIDFWATWCAPCREEIPMLNALHDGYREQGLTILAITDEDADIVAPFAEEHGVSYTNLVRGDETFTQYGALGLPTAYLVDGEGRIVETFFGPKPRRVLENKIRELLDLPPLT